VAWHGIQRYKVIQLVPSVAFSHDDVAWCGKLS